MIQYDGKYEYVLEKSLKTKIYPPREKASDYGKIKKNDSPCPTSYEY